MLDLSSLTPLLAGLGPWGLLIGVGLTLLVQWAKKKFPPGNPATPAVPSPGPQPDPAPGPFAPPTPQGQPRPLRDLLLQILPLLLARKHAAVVPPSTVVVAAAPVPAGPDPVEGDLLRLLAMIAGESAEMSPPKSVR